MSYTIKVLLSDQEAGTQRLVVEGFTDLETDVQVRAVTEGWSLVGRDSDVYGTVADLVAGVLNAGVRELAR